MICKAQNINLWAHDELKHITDTRNKELKGAWHNEQKQLPN